MKFANLLLGLVLAFSVSAEPSMVMTIDEAHAQVKLKCEKGCLILTPQEVANIESNIRKGFQENFLRGRAYEKSTI